MERATAAKTFNDSLPQKTPDRGNKDASFSASNLKPDEPFNGKQEQRAVDGCSSTIVDEISIFDAHKYFNDSSNIGAQKVSCNSRVLSRVFNVNVENLERGSERLDLSAALPGRFSSASSSVDGYTNGRNYGARSFHATTPTTSSEASWNSQAGLLSKPPGAISVSMQNVRHLDEKKVKGCGRTTARWFLGRKCPCSGKKSVQVREEKAPEPKTTPPPLPLLHQHDHPSTGPIMNLKRQSSKLENTLVAPNKWSQNSLFPSNLQGERAVVVASGRPFSSTNHGAGFTFPILNPSSLSSTAKSPPKLPVDIKARGISIIEDPPRHSLEVFRPSHETISVDTNNNSCKASQNFTFPASPKSRMNIDDEVASDASSDLFEIESFSTQAISYPITSHRRDSLDEASIFDARRLAANGSFLFTRRSLEDPMTPSSISDIARRIECYEPSEASIDWSVTTAEGFDRASVANLSVVASEFVDVETMIMQAGSDQRPDPEKRKRRLASASASASTSGNGLLLSCRCERAVSVGPNPVKGMSTAEGHREGPHLSTKSSTLRHVGSRPPIANKPPLARSPPARVSLPLAT
ncbi:protein PHYTOCHROME KINASE SUBSTRATE 4 [Juglans microcarpa x Juglans regia]|uniref:protein PHYTOCHROME KINASE SUBSTRATE 4 n=1 Tax=Juglans microcarpa x Juglans regia TaxID=2249226 RepID=UPI001B7F5D7A|nr:protein PHYTOCHROME KINASE SUBSTRATE 4 [Juglans microcarpa x Juglans regia]